jgi:DNA-binding MarR family transcriptional regulator
VLYAMELEQRRISVGGLCASSRVPATTALSWIRALTREGLIQKHSDPLDGRRVHVRLSPPGSEAMGAYFARIANYSQGL